MFHVEQSVLAILYVLDSEVLYCLRIAANSAKVTVDDQPDTLPAG